MALSKLKLASLHPNKKLDTDLKIEANDQLNKKYFKHLLSLKDIKKSEYTSKHYAAAWLIAY